MAQAAEPDFLQPTVAPEAPSAGALAIATPPSTPVTQEDEPAGQPDLSPYDWYPVLRRPRADGWTVDVQRRFIEVLADSGSVIEACLTVGKAKSSAYALRRSPGAEGVAAAWRIAIDNAAARALDECFERALVGTDEPVFDRDGRRVGRRLRQSDRLLMFILRAYMPDRFRHAARDVRTPDEPPAPAVEPVQQAIALVEPPRPARPEELMDADTLESRLWCAISWKANGRAGTRECRTTPPLPSRWTRTSRPHWRTPSAPRAGCRRSKRTRTTTGMTNSVHFGPLPA
jgi:hypothetical protein